VLNDLNLNRRKLDYLASLDHTAACERDLTLRALLKRVLNTGSNFIELAGEAV
jgi:hypothetical protein